MRSNTKATMKLSYAAMILAVAVLFPQLFHLTGIPNAGKMLLPMHIPVLVCGLWLGPFFGGAVGALAPFLSCMITQMPSVASMPFMVLELAAYGCFCGLFYRVLKLDRFRFGVYPALIISMVIGRCVYALSLFVASELIGLKVGGAILALTATAAGAVGIVIQIIFVPLLVAYLERIVKFREC